MKSGGAAATIHFFGLGGLVLKQLLDGIGDPLARASAKEVAHPGGRQIHRADKGVHAAVPLADRRLDVFRMHGLSERAHRFAISCCGPINWTQDPLLSTYEVCFFVPAGLTAEISRA